MTKACINGSLELAVTASNVVANISPELGLLDAPFLFRDAAHARAVLDGPIGAEYAALLHPKGVIVLAWAENGLRHITANRPVRKPDDLRGMHIRVPQSDVMVDAFKALGWQGLHLHTQPATLACSRFAGSQRDAFVGVQAADLDLQGLR